MFIYVPRTINKQIYKRELIKITNNDYNTINNNNKFAKN